MIIPYSKAKGLIKEADVILFLSGKFPGVGWWISKYTQSPYSHAALAHWKNGELYCVEFREFKGSRMYKMDDYVANGQHIDIFRCAETIIIPHVKKDTFNNQYYTAYYEFVFNADIAISIIETALELLGRPYSYWTIWQIFKNYIPFIRLGRKIIKGGEPDTKSFVCSTLVTYTYRKHYVDPVPFLSDWATTPGDLARSSLFSYLFSIKS